MIDPSFTLQTGIRSNLINAAALTSLVNADSVFDGRARPEDFPCIIIGEGQTVLEGTTYTRKHVRVYTDLHIWTQESGLSEVKNISGAVASALSADPTISDCHLIDFMIGSIRYLRDPANEYGHAIVSVEALIELIQ